MAGRSFDKLRVRGGKRRPFYRLRVGCGRRQPLMVNNGSAVRNSSELRGKEQLTASLEGV